MALAEQRLLLQVLLERSLQSRAEYLFQTVSCLLWICPGFLTKGHKETQIQSNKYIIRVHSEKFFFSTISVSSWRLAAFPSLGWVQHQIVWMGWGLSGGHADCAVYSHHPSFPGKSSKQGSRCQGYGMWFCLATQNPLGEREA